MRLLLTALVFACAPTALAQDLAEPLRPYAGLIGEWEGTAWAMTRNGRVEIRQTERVRPMLGGQILTVEGTGRDEHGEIAFNAFGVFSVDAETGTVSLDAFTHEGRHTRVQPVAVEDGFDWTVRPDAGPVIRYEMRFDEAGRWTENGRVSLDGGETWIHTFSMTLERTDD